MSVAVSKPRLGRPPSMANPRQAILDHAASLFAARGYETSSLNDLAEAMGLSKAALYNYFASKQDLYDAVILQTLSALAGAVEAAVPAGACGPVALRAFMAAHAQCFEAHHDGFVTMLVGFSGMTNREFKDDALRLRDAHEHRLRGIIQGGVAAGELRPVDAETTARAILSMLSWMARWFKPGGAKTARAIADDYYHLLLPGLLPPKD